jgi:hypothetical protein
MNDVDQKIQKILIFITGLYFLFITGCTPLEKIEDKEQWITFVKSEEGKPEILVAYDLNNQQSIETALESELDVHTVMSSPNHKYVSFIASEESNLVLKIYTLSKLELVTTISLLSDQAIEYFERSDDGFPYWRFFEWSPDGRYLAFVMSPENDDEPGVRLSVFVYDTRTGTLNQASQGLYSRLVGWSPKGDYLLYLSDDTWQYASYKKSTLVGVRVDDFKEKRLFDITKGAYWVTIAGWLSDEDVILYDVFWEASLPRNIRNVNVSGGQYEVIYDDVFEDVIVDPKHRELLFRSTSYSWGVETGKKNGLYWIDIDTGDVKEVVLGLHTAEWSNIFGTFLVHKTFFEEPHKHYLFNRDSFQLDILLEGELESISPNGQFAIIRDREELYLVTLDYEVIKIYAVIKTIEKFADNEIEWLPDSSGFLYWENKSEEKYPPMFQLSLYIVKNDEFVPIDNHIKAFSQITTP